MKWNAIVDKSIKNGRSTLLLKDTSEEMQRIIDYVMESEPDLYWEFKSSVLCAVNGSPNDGYGIDEDEYPIDYE